MITRVLGSTDLAVSETVGAIAEMLELRRFGLSPGGPQQCLVFVEVDGPPGPATRAGLPQGSASAFRAEDGVVGAGERACQPVGADDRARRLLDVDVVESESARHGGAERDRFAERLVSGLDKLGPSLPGAVGQVGQHLERCVDTIARIQRSNGGFES